MTRSLRRCFIWWHFLPFLFLSLSVIPRSSVAEVIHLKSGKTVEGKILEKTDKYVRIDFLGVKLTYYLDEIDHIEKGSSQAPLQKEPPPASVEQGHTFRNEELGVSFSVPATWSEDRSLLNKTILAAFEHSSKRISSHIILISLPPPPWAKLLKVNLLDFAKIIAPQIQVLAGAKTIPQPYKVSVGSKEALVTSSEGIVGGATAVVIDYSFLDSMRKRIYSLRFSSARAPGSSQEVLDADKTDFLSAVDSFAIH